MIERGELLSLIERPQKLGDRVLSIYLDTDQSNAAKIERAFETVLKSMLREIRHNLAKEAREQFVKTPSRPANLLKTIASQRKASSFSAMRRLVRFTCI